MPDHPASPSDDDIAALLDAGFAHRHAGRIEAALAQFSRVLEQNPRNPDALHQMGLMALEVGNVGCAAGFIDRAIEQAPERAHYLRDRATIAARMNEHALAADCLRRAIALAPDVVGAHDDLGNSLMHLGDPAGAAQQYRIARALEPRLPWFAFNLGRALECIGNREEALAQFREADALAPNHSLTLVHIGRLLRETGRAEEAVARLEPLVEREPEHVAALFELAFALDSLNRFDQAVRLYRRAQALDPEAASIANNLAFSLTGLARYDEAESQFRRALELDPDLREAAFQLGMLLLRRGDYANGWPLFENRKSTADHQCNYRRLPCPEWQGEPLAGQRFLIAREQGAGDELQFIRYAARLAAEGAHVDAWTAPELAALVATVPGVARALDAAPGDEIIAAQYDFWCDGASLPLKFPGEPIPADTPYMCADAGQVALWRARVMTLAPHARRRVGLVWAGNPRHRFDAFRSIRLDTLLPLASLKDHAWFAIQKGPAAAQLNDIAHAWPMHAVGADLHDFASTAALIESLDLVITVDTSVAHLAGALGKPVWIMLAALPDWRWGASGNDSVWYPSARLFRQQTPGNWSSMVAQLVDALT